MAHVREGTTSSVPELIPFENEVYGGKKSSTLDSLKRAFQVDTETGKKEPSGKETAFVKNKKQKKIVPQYDPIKDGPLVEPDSTGRLPGN